MNLLQAHVIALVNALISVGENGEILRYGDATRLGQLKRSFVEFTACMKEHGYRHQLPEGCKGPRDSRVLEFLAEALFVYVVMRNLGNVALMIDEFLELINSRAPQILPDDKVIFIETFRNTVVH